MEVVVSQDLIEGILLRLPVKSLSRFKCVCRSWHDLISDHNFVRAQINYAKSSCDHGEKDPTLLLYFCNPDAGDQLIVCDRRRIDDELYNPLLSRRIDLPPQFVDFRMFNSCDGMFCVSVETYESTTFSTKDIAHWSVFLWNPIIHDLKRLPLPFEMKHAVCDCGMEININECTFGDKIFAVGYNPSIDDYYICKIPTTDSPPESPVELLYLKSNSNWKPIANFWQRYQVEFWERPKYFNGNLYIMARRVVDAADAYIQRRVILCYNGVEEKFEEIALPENCKYAELDIIERHHPLRLIALRYLFYKEEDASWSLFQHDPDAYNYGELHSPICIISSCIYFVKEVERYGTTGEEEEQFESGVVKYDFENKMVCYYKKWSSRFIRFQFQLEFIESLMSPTTLIPGPQN